MATRKKTESRPARVPDIPARRDAETSWLERSNPLAGLSIRDAQAVFDAARAGDTQRLHWIYQEIEAVNPVLMTCVERRAAAVANFQATFAAIPGADKGLADEQKDAAQRLLAGIDNFTELLEHLDGAFFRGFALAQPLWNADGTLAEVALHNSWEFLNHDGATYHNPVCDGWGPNCVPCDAAGLVGVERRRAIDYPALAVHIRAAVGERDWGRFVERHAMPKPAVTMAPNATDELRDDYIKAAKCVERGQVSVWPAGSSITDFAGGSRGTDPFSSFIRHQEERIVLLSTGGTLTSLAQADTGALAGGAQMEVWREIVRRDAGVLAQAVHRSIVRPYLAHAFGGRGCAVDLSLDIPRKPSPKEAAEVAAVLRQAGWIVDRAELEAATGFTLEREPAAPAFGTAKAAPGKGAETRLQTLAKGVQNASSGKDGEADAEDAEGLKTPLKSVEKASVSDVLADAIMERMAQAMAEELAKGEPKDED